MSDQEPYLAYEVLSLQVNTVSVNIESDFDVSDHGLEGKFDRYARYVEAYSSSGTAMRFDDAPV